ncbi:XdhC family protein [bacterium]|nr:XdhC family protein [bacterium]
MDLFERLNQTVDAGQPVALCTVVNTKGSVPRHAGAKMLVFPDGEIDGTVGGGETEKLVRDEALAALADGRTRYLHYELIDAEKGDPGVCGGTVSVFVEPYLRMPTVVVVGAGHVGRAIVHLAKWLGYRVVLSDDRADLCTQENSPGANQYLPVPMGDLPEAMDINPQTYFVLVTRGVEVDVQGLPAILATDAAYIGLIGSKKRWAHCQEKLKEADVPDSLIERIKSPVGLNIHAETPNEIALSIMAEITDLRNDSRRHLRKA